MALQLHFHGVSSLQYVCHTRSSFPSTTTRPTGPSFAGMTTNACSKSSMLTSHSTHSPDKQRRPLRTVQCAAIAAKELCSDKGPKYDEKELPPLLASLEVEGLPPCQGSVYADEALAYVLTMGPTDLCKNYYAVSTSFLSFVHCGAVSAERLGVMAAMCTLMTISDDSLFDGQDGDRLEKLGIDRTILASPEKIMEHIRAMDALMRQEEEPASPTALEDMFWKVGRDLRALSPSREWFNLCVDALLAFFTAKFEKYCNSLGADSTAPLPDLATFTEVRYNTVGGLLIPCVIEFCENSYLPPEIHEHPVVQRLTTLAITYGGYIQEIFSFSKELVEGSTSNLLNVIMAGEPGMTLPQAAWKAVNMTRAVAQEFLELEATQLPSWEGEPWASDVRLYVEALKDFMSGFLYWHSKTKRYRHPDACFSEMRDVSVSFLPEPDSLKVIRK